MKLRLSDLKNVTCLKEVFRLARKCEEIVYLVGGTLRDCLLVRNGEYLDFDFALRKNSLIFARKLAQKLNAPFVMLNEPHGCARVVFKYKGIKANLDFSDFRSLTIEADLKKRDFTINALAINIADIFLNPARISRKIIDPCGGREDLKIGLVRLIGKGSFKEDPLRMLRAFSIAGRLGFKIEKATIKQVEKNKGQIKQSAGERIREELFKIFSQRNSYKYLIFLNKSGLLERIIPEIKLMYKIKQGLYHHLDVWTHSLETLRQLEDIIKTAKFRRNVDIRKYLSQETSSSHPRLALLKLAAILHDVGKPATFTHKQGKIHFHGHERVGAKLVETIAHRLRLSNKEIKQLKVLIYCHLRPGFMSDIPDLSRRALFRYFRDTGEEALSVALLSLADQRATKGRLKKAPNRLKHEKLIMSLIRNYLKQAKQEEKVPLVNGYDIMRKLRIKAGPLVGEVIEEINEAQAEGRLKNKRDALRWAKTFCGKTSS